MKILRVITSMKPEKGGPCQGIRNSIPTLQAMGIENEVACFDMPNENFLGKDSFVIHALGPLKGPYNYCAQLIPWLTENLGRFDAVIIHGLWLYNSYGTYKAWKSYKKKNENFPNLYIMPHGMLDPYFQKAPDRKLKSIRNSIIWTLIERNVVNNIDGILFTCEQELILARGTFSSYKPKKELNVGYGILPPPRFAATMQSSLTNLIPALKDRPYWLFLSRIHTKKGTDLLIKSYLKLKEKNYDLPMLVIAGPGLDTEYGHSLKKMAVNTPEIIFPGMLSGSEKWGAIYGAEVFILPSHQENFGISIVESMACGTPVIISDQVNIWSEIIKGKGGVVCNDNEVSTFEVLEKWVNLSNAEKAEYKAGALATYAEYFTTKQAAVQMIKTLQLS
jgi:glycosyltransferase involved in cell wall biosynthesis